MLLTTFLFLFRSFNNFKPDDKKGSYTNLKTIKSTNLQPNRHMINIPYDKFEVNDQSSCQKSAGTATLNQGCTISYTFTGVKVHILAQLESNSATGNIMIDNQLVRSIPFSSETQTNEIIFSSDELKFGTHTIGIQNQDAGKQIKIVSLFIEPYPIRQGFALGFDSLHDYTGDWTNASIPNVDAFTSNSNNAACTFKFYGTRFWLTGIRSSSYGNLDLILDYGRTIHIETKTTNEDLQNSMILLYESTELQFKEHTVTIHQSNGPIAISRLLFSIYPYYKIPTYSEEPQSIPISIPVSNMTKLTEDNNPICIVHTSCGNNNIDICGETCTNTNTSQKLEYQYTFKGERFQVYGSYTNGVYDVYLDNNLIKTVQQTDTSYYHLDYTSEIYPYGEHTIKISGTSEFSIYKIAFWPSIRAKRINLTDFSGITQWINESDHIGGIRYNTNSDEAKDLTTSSIRASNIWVYGTKASWHGAFNIRFADQNTECNLYSTDRIDFALVHEIQLNRPQEGNFTIDVGKATVQLNCIYYIEESITSMPVSIPLSEMTINSTIDERQYPRVCQNETIGLCGEVWTIKHFASIEYTFRGERFQIYGQHGPNHKSYNIYADNVYLTTIDQYNSNSTGYVLDYFSDTFPYGDHTIRVEGSEQFSIHKFTYWPSYKAKRIDITSFPNRTNWKTESDQIGGQRAYADGETSITHPAIHANRLWLFGTKAGWHHSGNFIFGSYVNESIDVDLADQNDRFDFEVLYDSPYFTNREAEVTIETHGTFMVNYLYYLDEPPLAMPIFIPPNSTNKTGAYSCDTLTPCNQTITNYPCGEKCWTTGTNYLSFEYEFKGECFEVYGNHGGDRLTNYSIYLDGVFLFQPNQRNALPVGNYQLDYTSIIVPYGLHTIKAEGEDGRKFEIFRFAYWPSVSAKRINATQLLRTGTWTTESDKIGGISILNENGDGKIEQSLGFEKIWIYGTLASWHGNCRIVFGKISEEFTFHINDGRINFALVYDSPVENANLFRINYNNDRQTTYYHYIYYLGADHLIIPTPSPCPTPPFTNSLLFSRSTEFSNSNSFSTSSGFSNSNSFSTSNAFSNSNSFSTSSGFSNSNSFSTSNEFSNSNSFSTSNGFSNSNSFSTSSGFSNSQSFSTSSEFSNSNSFSTSILFTSSIDFTTSLDFTKSTSLKPRPSTPFTLSTIFTQSLAFTKSTTFSKSSIFTSSTIFTESNTAVSIEVVTPSGDKNDNGSKSSTPIIIGVVAAILCLLIIALIIIIVALKKRRKDKEQSSEIEVNAHEFSITGLQAPEEGDEPNSEVFDIFEELANNDEDSGSNFE